METSWPRGSGHGNFTSAQRQCDGLPLAWRKLLILRNSSSQGCSCWQNRNSITQGWGKPTKPSLTTLTSVTQCNFVISEATLQYHCHKATNLCAQYNYFHKHRSNSHVYCCSMKSLCWKTLVDNMALLSGQILTSEVLVPAWKDF